MRRDAFTMVELILVIVIFGIIGSIGAEIIATMYKNYIYARTVNYLQSQSDVTLQQIAKRLQYRIKDTDTAVALRTDIGAILSLGDSGVNDDYDVIQWIGYSNEALLNAGGNPGWSGFIDLDNRLITNNATKTLSTPGSNLTFANDIISALTNKDVTMGNGVVLIFRGIPQSIVTNPVDGYNWRGNGREGNYTVLVSQKDIDVFAIKDDSPNKISEHYYLAHTAYAIVPNTAGGSDTNFNLELKYNFQPWLDEKYTDEKTSTALLATNVNLFRVRQTGSTIRLKLCLHDDNKSGTGDYIVTCKEEVVL
jgi:prepilin-type N-terminal cleavage/methylation domain-containing protein